MLVEHTENIELQYSLTIDTVILLVWDDLTAPNCNSPLDHQMCWRMISYDQIEIILLLGEKYFQFGLHAHSIIDLAALAQNARFGDLLAKKH